MKRKINSARNSLAMIFVFLVVSCLSLLSQDQKAQDLAQYLFPEFSRGMILTKACKMNNLILNYNTVSEKMVYEQKGQYYDIANPETTDTAILSGRKFIPYGKVFLEVVVKGETPFFIQRKSELVAPGRPAGYGQTSQLTASNYLTGIETPSGYYNFKLPDGYTVRATPVYWLRRGGEMHSFLGEKQFLKIFPDKSAILKKFIKDNRIRFERENDLLKLVAFCNELNQMAAGAGKN